jgi:V8-like Glu-specific endopeptidase
MKTNEMKPVAFILMLSVWSTVAVAQTVADVSALPFKCVCKIEKMIGTATYKATGFLIAPNLVLTNAHVLDEADQMVIFPGYDPDERDAVHQTLNIQRGVNAFSPAEYESSTETPQHDYALLILPEPFTHIERDTCFRPQSFSKVVSDKFATRIFIAGYPHWRWFEFGRHRDHQFVNNGFLVQGFGGRMPDANLNYRFNTRKSNSGSPLWIERGGQYIVVGIHKSGSGFKDQGVEMTDEILATINGWLKR